MSKITLLELERDVASDTLEINVSSYLSEFGMEVEATEVILKYEKILRAIANDLSSLLRNGALKYKEEEIDD